MYIIYVKINLNLFYFKFAFLEIRNLLSQFEIIKIKNNNN